MLTKRQWRNMGSIAMAAVSLSMFELALLSNLIVNFADIIMLGNILEFSIKTMAIVVSWNGIYVIACLLANFVFEAHVDKNKDIIDTPNMVFMDEK